MFKLGQKVLLPIHEVIGEVVMVTETKTVIRVTGKENYDFITTPEGFLPHTQVSMVENIMFTENENIFVKNNENQITIGKITNIRVIKNNNNCELIADFRKEETEETRIVALNECYKLFGLKKIIDKLCRENDRFKHELP